MVDLVSKYGLWFVDLDGVVWRGADVLGDNVEGVLQLMNAGRDVVFITNNSTRSRRLLRLMLSKVGIEVDERRVVNSGYATSVYLKLNYGLGTVLVVGESGLVEELVLQGFIVVDEDYALRHGVDYVVVGLDRNLSFRKLEAALHALKRGAMFVATNTDATLPVGEGRVVPGAGSVVSLLERSSGRKPDLVVGKPNTAILEVALSALGRVSKADCIVVGDRLDTDMAMAKEFGVDSLLVLTGVVADVGSVRESPFKPTYVSRSILHAVRGELLTP